MQHVPGSGTCHMSSHVTVHADDTVFKCSVCNMPFRVKWSLEKQMILRVSRWVDEVRERSVSKCVPPKSLPKPQEIFQCRQCPKVFRSVRTLTYHLRLHNERSSYLCLSCSTPSPSKGSLIERIRRHMAKGGSMQNYVATVGPSLRTDPAA